MIKLNTKVRIAELDDTARRISEFYGTHPELKNEPFLSPLFASMKTLLGQISEAIRRDKALSNLADADAVRDEAISDVYKIVEGYAVMRINRLSGPAQKLSSLLRNFRGAPKQNYTAESSLIEAMLKDLERFSAEIDDLIGLPEAIDFLRQTQNDFAEKRQVLEKDQAQHKQLATASALKDPLLSLLNDQLVPYLSSVKMSDPAKYGTLADQVQTAIDATNTTLKTRRSQRSETKPKMGG